MQFFHIMFNVYSKQDGWGGALWYRAYIYIYIYIYTVLSVNEYTPFEKYNFKQYLNEHKKNISKMLTRLSLK